MSTGTYKEVFEKKRRQLVNLDEKLGLHVGDRLWQCTQGFSWNETWTGFGPNKPDYVVVIGCFRNHVVVEAHFESKGGGHYCESINKTAALCGAYNFRKVKEN